VDHPFAERWRVRGGGGASAGGCNGAGRGGGEGTRGGGDSILTRRGRGRLARGEDLGGGDGRGDGWRGGQAGPSTWLDAGFQCGPYFFVGGREYGGARGGGPRRRGSRGGNGGPAGGIRPPAVIGGKGERILGITGTDVANSEGELEFAGMPAGPCLFWEVKAI